jgi:hypothetical protein
MKKPQSVAALEEFGRVRLSESFFMRDFLYSEIANFYGMPNIPDHPDQAIEAGRMLCENLLEPLQRRFGRISIRSAYRSPSVNRKGNENGHNCSTNEKNFAGHIWDYPDGEGRIGATATVVVNSFVGYYERTGDWQAMAWWVHDHLDYCDMEFFPRLAAFNLQWRQAPRRAIYSFIPPQKGWLTKPGLPNHLGSHAEAYADWLDEFSRDPAPKDLHPAME